MNNVQNRIVINKEVFVPELYFRAEQIARPVSPRERRRRPLRSYPRRMEYQGREYTFMDGLRYLVQKGHQLVQVFDMTDGRNDYRLQFNSGDNAWTLVDMSA
jgi:hypothetical protein